MKRGKNFLNERENIPLWKERTSLMREETYLYKNMGGPTPLRHAQERTK